MTKLDTSDPSALAAHFEQTAALLESLAVDRGPLSLVDEALKKRLLEAAGRFSRPEAKEARALGRAKRRDKKEERREADSALLDRTGIRQLRENPLFETPRRRLLTADATPGPTLGSTAEVRDCYVCHQPFTEVHAFYDQMCPACGDLSWRKRSQTADLTGRFALVTGGRVKIGYQTAIMLLRAGATVHVTTRFPHDAARRFDREEDADTWRHRLVVHGIDLRHTPSVEALCDRLLAELPRLDVLINNACQTVRRPPGFYEHLMEGEAPSAPALTDAAEALLAPGSPAPDFGAHTPVGALSLIPLVPGDPLRGEHLFPTGRLDADEQQVDLRRVNSWRLRLAEVPTIELLEVHLVNAVAPFVMNARLKPLMAAVPTHDAHIVNVSAMEGQFYRTHKSDRHPHTNMAKAALNMMTRTSAADYVEHGIHMNSVDTGWVTDEDPAVKADEKREMHGFTPPLDIVDGAARICDPVFDGLNTGRHVWGQFLKDYASTDW